MRHETIYLREGRTDVKLTTYIIDDSFEILNGRKRPAVIICPGGGYWLTSDREGEPVALAFLRMGYHAFVLDYSVYGRDALTMTPETMPVREESLYPNAMCDLGAAVLMLKDHADEWLVDPDRIAVCGFSAGGHLCATYATNWTKPVLSDYFNRPKGDFKVAACVLGYTVFDMLWNYEQNGSKDDMISIALVGNNPSRKLLEEVSPNRNVDENTPPMFIWATSEDAIVPVQHSMMMAIALAEKNIPFDLHIFEEGPHGTALSDMTTAEACDMILPDAKKWCALCDAWLQKRFFLPLPAKLGEPNQY
ncbi:MAG: alpha/beta hydrolase [Lachnospiraceae bacterium]|nr:alpha/beta hydrolase [Lachnospiraceae bacterium]